MARSIGVEQQRLPVVIDTVAAVSALLPERVAAPLQNGAAWAIRNQGAPPPGAQELIASRQVGNLDQAAIYLGAVGLIRDQLDRETDERIARSERVVPRSRLDLDKGQDRGR